ncbi:sigma-E factor negative regulatory protein [Pseudomonas neustonica]|uniref:RNA polymerase subunit sigma n=1 Tax=Pseudomonas neustonica TaxID=2487346 RepID=A0ABX9XKD1_9PSED|nr:MULTISPECIES: RseA family anti-sigma factor [Pseudomonas]MBA6418618.1 RNA polymerase subunit sigma [Pseudomonas sp. 5Ae-yellow]ROZ85060.1 RNA polymerase subunit sigma [Pseudomonas sp. SSM44]ROZ86653.1 RNA polymerase subunit sigma [Pseudomonas neustonica]|tara:strand:+ start:14555 stop:15181 length:627 start_codon:yes stop_codon:yes gene_type:complete
MRNEVLQESLSALMDNEADELEVRRVLQAAEQDPTVRGTWERYQIARSVLHKEHWQGSVDLSAGIAAALRDEPQLQVAAESAAPLKSGLWRNMSRVAVAASVTMAVLVGVRMVNQGDVPAQPTLAVENTVEVPSFAAAGGMSTRSGAVLAGYSQQPGVGAEPLAAAKAPSAWHEQRIGRYLREHAENSAQSSSPQLVPYARAASIEGR